MRLKREKKMQRIGVFICWCGSNIAATVDVKKVAEVIKAEPNVVYSADYQYMCSENGQQLLKNAIKEHNLTGVVIGSCSPRMHEATFRKAAAEAGLNPYMLEVANIREQCSWIHKDMEEATEKALILIRTAIAKVRLNSPLTEGESPVTKRALVIGGGIAGIQAALDIARKLPDAPETFEQAQFPVKPNAQKIPKGLRTEIRQIMQDNYFVIPNRDKLADGLKRVTEIRELLLNGNYIVDADYVEAKSLATVAYIILKEVL